MRQTITAIIIAAMSLTATAQQLPGILNSISDNNTELRAMRKSISATDAENAAANMPDGPSVEYSPFFAGGTKGVASSELVVSQEFDFPTLYAARNKSRKMQLDVLEKEYKTARRDLLLNATGLYLELVMLNKEKAILTDRLNNSTEMLGLYEKRLEHGNATSLEVNMIKLERMDLQTATAQNEMQRQNLMSQLTALNANKPIEVTDREYPTTNADTTYANLHSSLVTNDAATITAAAAVKATTQELKVSRQGWLPSISIGYRRNTELGEHLNGFLVGASFPIYSQSSKIKAAKLRHEGAQLQLDYAVEQAESNLKKLTEEMKQLQIATKAYDPKLMTETLELLGKSVNAGATTLTDYYSEADKIYQKLQEYLTLELRYQKLVAELGKNAL